jgi:hypothetical protein
VGREPGRSRLLDWPVNVAWICVELVPIAVVLYGVVALLGWLVSLVVLLFE